ncbi:MAG: TGS domain-containing protein [Chloroflexi bacterium]|nr:TGS domain-containing protein [Chloroflexota bacterium]
MPANLPPDYFAAEKQYREAKNAQEKIQLLKKMLAIMPKHKGTDKLRAELRRRIANLGDASEKRYATQRASLFNIPKEGAAQVAVVGLANSGKSQLVSVTTNATSLVAEYPFTTREAIPGMMEFENIQIQLIDTPALAPQTIEPWLPHLLRRADGLLIMLDLSGDPLPQMEAVLKHLQAMKVDITGKKVLVVGNKLDTPGAQRNLMTLKYVYEKQFRIAGISAKTGAGLEEMRRHLFEALDIIRVYTKAPGKEPDFTGPVVLKRGSTVEEAAAQVHKDFAAHLKFARIWGSGKHEGIPASRDHVLQDGDVVELHI